MDPNESLERLRAWVRWFSEDTREENPMSCARAARLFDALDVWLSRGGFLPVKWEQPLEDHEMDERGLRAHSLEAEITKLIKEIERSP